MSESAAEHKVEISEQSKLSRFNECFDISAESPLP